MIITVYVIYQKISYIFDVLNKICYNNIIVTQL